jgi:hypothetical protein
MQSNLVEEEEKKTKKNIYFVLFYFLFFKYIIKFLLISGLNCCFCFHFEKKNKYIYNRLLNYFNQNIRKLK